MNRQRCHQRPRREGHEPSRNRGQHCTATSESGRHSFINASTIRYERNAMSVRVGFGLPACREAGALINQSVTASVHRADCGFAVEMCMGMGFPVGMGIPWDSHGNGNDFRGSRNVGKCFANKLPLTSNLKLTKELRHR